jgi:3-deoxy-manno-octulosonate cytidylyltransferase (CMP-KDO synthetase)
MRMSARLSATTKLLIAIPARLKSTRLAKKPLLLLAGKPIVAHVLERAIAFAQSAALQAVGKIFHANLDASIVLATDSEEIADIARAMSVMVCMTRADHATGSDRLAECAAQLALDPQTIVLNLQGDEPLMPESCLASVVRLLLANSNAAMATLATPIQSVQELFDINVVKLVTRADQRALYFSRAPIPYARDQFGALIDAPEKAQASILEQFPYHRHLGLYAYRAGALLQIAAAPQSALEQAESLEQLRALDLGLEIVVGIAPEVIPPGIDTIDDLQRVERYMSAVSPDRPDLSSLSQKTEASPADLAAHAYDNPQKKRAAWATQKVLFVCMGNICRSPLAHAYALKQAGALGFTGLEFASRATIASTSKQPADLRTQAIARAAGLNLSQHRAQQIKTSDFYDYDLIIAHDDRNIADLKNVCPDGLMDKVKLLMSFAEDALRADVPDPYMGDHEDFILSWRLIKQGVDALLEQLRA